MIGSTWSIDGREIRGGTTQVLGFKHSLVSVVAATVSSRSRLVIDNAPDILETTVLAALLRDRGVRVARKGSTLELDSTTVVGGNLDPSLSSRIHGAHYLVPALLGAGENLRFAQTGGCAIGDGPQRKRPVGHMLEVLRRHGACFEPEPGGWTLGRPGHWTAANHDIFNYSESPEVLTGPHISGATKTALIAGLGGNEGPTRVVHPYPKPDVTDLIRLAELKGGLIEASPSQVTLRPPERISAEHTHHIYLTPDLSEIMTFLVLGLMLDVELTVVAAQMELVRQGLAAECQLLEQMGVELHWTSSSVQASAPACLRAIDIEVTSVGIYSDHQPLFALLFTRADGPGRIRERVWTTRFDYVDELRAYGVSTERGTGEATIWPGPLQIPSGVVRATDLRMAAVLVIAGLACGGPAVVAGIDHLERGYSMLPERLASLGARVDTSTTLV